MNTPTGITIPTFEAKERAKAIAELQQLPPSVLPYCSDLIKQFNSKKNDEIDDQAARELISELTYCYFRFCRISKRRRADQVDCDARPLDESTCSTSKGCAFRST